VIVNMCCPMCKSPVLGWGDYIETRDTTCIRELNCGYCDARLKLGNPFRSDGEMCCDYKVVSLSDYKFSDVKEGKL
jgi:hypothetical protein